MANLADRVPNDAEIDAMATPRNQKAAKALEHKREVRRKIDDYLADVQLRKDIGEDDFF
ncbi:PA3496 family putative envelope integrity protein [Shewanella maritima]|uniref:PA3496 family putative envelope integrity protein n=1 Tax=Shewanella maritima TaxID=2520507 RepID=UPI00373616C0